MVVCDWRIAHSFRADGTGGRARSARRIFTRQWSRRIPLVCDHNFRWRIVGWLRGLGDETAPIDTEFEDRCVDAVFEMSGLYAGRASLYTGESEALCPLCELRVLDRPCRPAPFFSQSH